MRHILKSLVVLGTVAACSPAPDLDGMVTDGARMAGFPFLKAVRARAIAPEDAEQANATATTLQNREAALRARAEILRSADEMDDQTRKRLLALLKKQQSRG